MHRRLFVLMLIGFILSSCATPTQLQPTSQPQVPTATQYQVQTVEPTLIEPTESLPTASATPPFAHVKVSSSRVISVGPLFVTDAEGFFTEQNLDVELITFNRGSEALPLLANGDLDVFYGGLDTGVINTIRSGENIAVVADKGYLGRGGCTYMGILLRQDLFESDAIRRPSDLRGQTISAGKASLSAYFLYHYLQQDGLTLKDVVLNEIPKEAVAEAFANKSIVAAILQDPALAQVAATGEASIWLKSEDIMPGFQVGVVIYGPRLIKDEPDVGIRFMVAYLKGIKQYNQGKTDRNVEIISQYTEIPKENIVASCWPTLREDGTINFHSLDEYQQWNIAEGYMEQAVTEEEFWNPYFAEQAYAILNQ